MPRDSPKAQLLLSETCIGTTAASTKCLQSILTPPTAWKGKGAKAACLQLPGQPAAGMAPAPPPAAPPATFHC